MYSDINSSSDTFWLFAVIFFCLDLFGCTKSEYAALSDCFDDSSFLVCEGFIFCCFWLLDKINLSVTVAFSDWLSSRLSRMYSEAYSDSSVAL